MQEERKRQLHVAHLAVRASDQGLDHGAALVVQQVHLVDDEQLHDGCHRDIPPLAGDDIPLLGGGHNHRGSCHVLLAQLGVSC